MDYVIWIYSGLIQKSISYLEKTSRLCNPETNHTFEKKKTFRLHNLEANLMYRKDFQIM